MIYEVEEVNEIEEREENNDLRCETTARLPGSAVLPRKKRQKVTWPKRGEGYAAEETHQKAKRRI